MNVHEVFAWICTEPDGSEGIVGAKVDGTGLTVPLVGDNLAGMHALRHWAEAYHRRTGWPVRLMRFSTRSTVEEL